MLKSIEGVEMDRIPHQKEYNSLVCLLDPLEMQRIEYYLTEYASWNSYFVSSWVPGSDWTGTVFEPIYKAIGDVDLTGKMFGLILWKVLMDHDLEWFFLKKENKEGGTTYFCRNHPMKS